MRIENRKVARESSLCTLHVSLRNFQLSSSSSSRSGQNFHPPAHSLFRLRDIGRGEKFQRIDPIYRIDGTMEVLLKSERHCSIDSHSAFEASIRRRPLLLARR